MATLSPRAIIVIDIEVIENLSALLALRQDWNPLLARSWSRSVFLTWEWIEAWWQTYHVGFDLLVLVARQAGAVCGIAPLVVRRSSRRLEFFGQNKAYGEYLDVLVPRGLERDITPAVCERIIRLGELGKWQSVHLATVSSESPNLAIMEQELAKRGVEVLRSAVRVCPFVELPTSWEEYLTLKGTTFKRRLEYYSRRLARSGYVVVEVPRNAREVDDVFDDVVRLHNHRWHTPIDGRFWSFHRRVARAFFLLNQLLLVRLRVGETVVAARYDFVFDNKAWNYQGGWLTEFGDRRVGTLMLCEVLRLCIQMGVREYDFLEGDAVYKRRLSTSHRTAFDLAYRSECNAYIFGDASQDEGAVDERYD